MLTPEQIADGWIEHDGGPWPVALDSCPGIIFRDGEVIPIGQYSAGPWYWWVSQTTNPRDIIAYRPETPA